MKDQSYPIENCYFLLTALSYHCYNQQPDKQQQCMLYDILPGFLKGAEPNHCGWGTPSDTPPPPSSLTPMKSGNQDGSCSWGSAHFFFLINGTGKKPALRGWQDTMATILEKVALELSYFLTIIASPPHQKPIKTEMGGAQTLKSVGVVMETDELSQNLTRVPGLKNKLLGPFVYPPLL